MVGAVQGKSSSFWGAVGVGRRGSREQRAGSGRQDSMARLGSSVEPSGRVLRGASTATNTGTAA
jgi:hypothetical protein